MLIKSSEGNKILHLQVPLSTLIRTKMEKLGFNQTELSEYSREKGFYIPRGCICQIVTGKYMKTKRRFPPKLQKRFEGVFDDTIIRIKRDGFLWKSVISEVEEEMVIAHDSFVDFRNSNQWKLFSVTKEEEEWLRSIAFQGCEPTKETYIELLYIYRKRTGKVV